MRDLQTQIDQFTALQPPIWQSVSVTASEAADVPVSFITPLVVTGRPEHQVTELAVPSIVTQFHFASAPENAQVVLIPQDSGLELASALLSRDIEELNDEVVVEIRRPLEAIIQGICLGVSNIRSEPYLASGVVVRFQIFSLPASLHNADTLCRTNVAWEIGNARGPVIWLIDEHTLAEITGANSEEHEAAVFGTSEGAGSYPTEGSTALKPEAAPSGDGSLEILLDIPLDVTVEMGRVKMQVKDVVELGTGSIVELDRAAGEPVDVLVNGRVVARGEVVVIEDNFGVRITEVLTPVERLKRLGDRE
jgi:flagellar motor switch protein FliN/FliY